MRMALSRGVALPNQYFFPPIYFETESIGYETYAHPFQSGEQVGFWPVLIQDHGDTLITETVVWK
jgi:hypothetical protein